MGFFDSIGKFAGEQLADLKRKHDMAVELKPQFEGYDDETLKLMYRQTDGLYRIAIGMVLRDRGYGK